MAPTGAPAAEMVVKMEEEENGFALCGGCGGSVSLSCKGKRGQTNLGKFFF